MPELAKINVSKKKPLLLLSPLDWGLGHTVRCIPIIRELLLLDCVVIVACTSKQKAVLQTEFPLLEFVELEGYDIDYGTTEAMTLGKIIWQIPKILIRVKREKRWLKRFLQNNKVDAIISDNRYGFYSPHVPSIFVTHQLAIKSGISKWIDKIMQWWAYKNINRFKECWVPDFEKNENLAGELSHPKKLPQIPVTYLGGISRFDACPYSVCTNRILIILSGPEPQRSIFEKLLLDELKFIKETAILVRGLPSSEETINSSPNLTILNHVAAYELNLLVCSSEIIISRSGYTTIMDLLKLKKKTVMIPTPGQEEQKYLANYLTSKQLVYSTTQDSFTLNDTLERIQRFQFKQITTSMEQYKATIRKFADSLIKSGF